MRAFGFIGMAVVSGVGLLGLGGCASTSSARSEPTTGAATAPAHEHDMGMMGDMCPMQVADTTVRSADVEGGVALDFTTSTGDVAELRQRVRRMADMHNQRHQGGMMMGGPHEVGGAPGEHQHDGGASGQRGCCEGMMKSGGMMMPPATATVEDITSGARIVLRPKDPAQLGTLREHARMRADRMARGECPMMSPEMMHGAGPGMGSAPPQPTPSPEGK